MPQFVIERNIAGAGKLTPAELQAISAASCGVLRELGPSIQWVHSYVTDDKIYCIYRAESDDLREVVGGCVEGYRLAYPDRPIAYDGPSEPLEVDGVPEFVAQALDKLVENAMDFATGGTVEVALARVGAQARLTVANEGPPLPEGDAERLFEPLVSIRGKEGRGPHLGIGLAIVRIVATRHGGGVRAVDRPDGKGVIVEVSLPLASASAVPPTPTRSTPTMGTRSHHCGPLQANSQSNSTGPASVQPTLAACRSPLGSPTDRKICIPAFPDGLDTG